MNREQMEAMNLLKRKKEILTRQQRRTIKGQILAGDTAGAMRGLHKLVARAKACQGCDCCAS